MNNNNIPSFLGKKTNNPITSDTLTNNDKINYISTSDGSKNLINKDNQETEKKYIYYCSLCGNKAFISPVSFDTFQHRRGDDSIICLLKENNVENLLTKDKQIIIRRGKNRYEKQFTYKCDNCGILMAYQATDFEEDTKENKNKELIMELLNKKEKKILYILNDSIIKDPSDSSLHSEIEKILTGTALEQSRKKYIDSMKIHKKL